MKKFLVSFLAAAALLLGACGHGDGEQSANCLDKTDPSTPKVVDPSFCRDVNPSGGGGGGNGSLTGSTFTDLLLFSWLFSPHYIPYGTAMTPAAVQQYKATPTYNNHTTYKVPNGSKITTDKTGKTTITTPKSPSSPPKAPAPKPAAPAKPPASAPKPAAPAPRTAPAPSRPSSPPSRGGGGFSGGGGRR